MDLTGKVISSSCTIRKSVITDVGSDIPGQHYSISVLKEGYCVSEVDGCTRADGTITLLIGPKTILVDTGGPWDRDFLLAQLEKRGLKPGDINIVVGTHGHSDHVGNLGLFPDALIVVGCDISQGDLYLPNELADGQPYPIDDHALIVPTPGHTGRDVSVLVRETSMGVVLVAGDLFECCNDDDSWRMLSENPEVQEISRRAALHTADAIIPGHGPWFKVHRESTN